MKLSMRWLREWVNPSLSDPALAAQLTQAGLEVDSLEPAGVAPVGVVAARLLKSAPHPAEDMLRVCHLDGGGADPVQVLCAASVRLSPGSHYAYAPVGTELPGGRCVEVQQCGDIMSAGMLCTYDDLGLEGGGKGLPCWEGQASPGQDAASLLDLEDLILDLALTPDRGDCLGLTGLAREVAALNALAYQCPQIPEVPAATTACVQVHVVRSMDCPRYLGRLVQGVDAAVPTPFWMAERLRRSGQRSVNVLVDITNYVMLELGQPMHAFDPAALEGEVRVRRAGRKESIQLLHGERVDLGRDCLLIADDAGPLALAGIMGGRRAEVTTATQDVFLESAFFTPQSVRGRAWRYGLHTDSSVRFERGVDPSVQCAAIQRATALVLQICGGSPGPLTEVCTPSRLPQRRAVRLRNRWLQQTLGEHIPAAEVGTYLQRLECVVQATAGGWRVTPPAHRYDLNLEEDLAAEVARMYGYDRLPARQPSLPLPMESLQPLPASLRVSRGLSRRLLEHGYTEVVTYSFADPALERLFSAAPAPVLVNPISEQAAVMRLSLWPRLLEVLRHNHHRQQERVRIFESGAVYPPQGEEPCLSGLVWGAQWQEQWDVVARPADFYDVKGDLQPWLPEGSRWQGVEAPGLHPGRSAELVLEGRRLGLLGLLHPAVARRLQLPAPWLFELYPQRFPRPAAARSEVPSRFPSVRRDLALVVEESCSAQSIIDAIREKCEHLLPKIIIFDVFRGEKLGKGQKSFAIGLIFQIKSSTLTDKDVDAAMVGIQQILKDKFGAELRA